MEQAAGVTPLLRGRFGVRWLHPAVIGTLIFITVLSGYLLSFNVDKPTHNADWYIRYQVTCSIVERNAFYINPYDSSQRSGPGLGGHDYAQYTLGQTTAMIPFYLLGRVLAGVTHTNCDTRVANTIVFLTAKSLDMVLGALLAALFYATGRLFRYTRRTALALTLIFAFGSSLWPDVLSGEEHTMESLFLLAAAYAALRYTKAQGARRKAKEEWGQSTESEGEGRRAKEGARIAGRRAIASGWRRALAPSDNGRTAQRLWLVVMGLAAGLVFVTRVAGLIAIPIFALYLVALHLQVVSRQSSVERTMTVAGRRITVDSGTSPHEPAGAARSLLRLTTDDLRLLLRDLTLYALGVLPSVVVNIVYDTLRFGKPWQTGPYPDHSFGFPPWLGLPDLLLSPGKGLLWYTPALFLLLLAARPFWRRCPRPALLFGLIGGVYLLFYANVNYWHGDPAWGPRYLYALLPYLLLPLGEVCARWRGYRLPLRGLVVAVLAASFLIQFSAVTVSYWRHWQFIYAYHYDQVENHSWGSNLHYWWKPEQSPIVISLEGIVDITQKYVDHAPLLQHPAQFRLSDPRESSIYQVFGQAAISLTDLDKLRYVANWNTFTPWWAHIYLYPWWSPRTVVSLALALAAIFVVAGALLLTLVIRADRRAPASLPVASRGAALHGPEMPTTPMMPTGTNGHNGHGHDDAGVLLAGMIVTGEQARQPVVTRGGGEALAAHTEAVADVTRPPIQATIPPHTPSRRPAAGPLPVGVAALVAGLVYGGIVYGAALRTLRTAPPLVRRVAMNTTVHDGDWAYRVLGVTSVPALPGGIDLPVDAAHHFVMVRLRIYNHLSRPQPAWPSWFDLTDSAGLRYQYMDDLTAQVAELYHQTPAGRVVPARSALDEVLIYEVRNTTPTSDLALLGPGITLVHLKA